MPANRHATNHRHVNRARRVARETWRGVFLAAEIDVASGNARSAVMWRPRLVFGARRLFRCELAHRVPFLVGQVDEHVWRCPHHQALHLLCEAVNPHGLIDGCIHPVPSATPDRTGQKPMSNQRACSDRFLPSLIGRSDRPHSPQCARTTASFQQPGPAQS
jgi:hypothetical protein